MLYKEDRQGNVLTQGAKIWRLYTENPERKCVVTGCSDLDFFRNQIIQEHVLVLEAQFWRLYEHNTQENVSILEA